MIYGLYLSAQGAEAQSLRQAVLANNLANAQTTAFKRDVPIFRAFPTFDHAQHTGAEVPSRIEDQTGGVALSGTVTDFQQGPLEVTHRDLDVAIAGRGFLNVNAGDETLLTRNGKLTINEQGVLVTADQGHPVLDISGQPIEIPEDVREFDITSDGQISGTGLGGLRSILGQIGLVEPNNLQQMIKLGDSFYRSLEGVQPNATGQFRQGVLEASTTNPVTGMVELIETSRSFEMNMNLIQYQDEMLGQLIQSLPRK